MTLPYCLNPPKKKLPQISKSLFLVFLPNPLASFVDFSLASRNPHTPQRDEEQINASPTVYIWNLFGAPRKDVNSLRSCSSMTSSTWSIVESARPSVVTISKSFHQNGSLSTMNARWRCHYEPSLLLRSLSSQALRRQRCSRFHYLEQFAYIANFCAAKDLVYVDVGLDVLLIWAF